MGLLDEGDGIRDDPFFPFFKDFIFEGFGEDVFGDFFFDFKPERGIFGFGLGLGSGDKTEVKGPRGDN